MLCMPCILVKNSEDTGARVEGLSPIILKKIITSSEAKKYLKIKINLKSEF
jgi:hypothetical protein